MNGLPPSGPGQPTSGLSPIRFTWSLMSTMSPTASSGAIPPAALVTTSVSAPMALRQANRERDLSRREALVAVDPALERNDALAAEVAHDQTAAMADDVSLGTREAGDLGERDHRRLFDRIGQLGEPGAEDQRDLDRAQDSSDGGSATCELV